jgi:hypothetical protein
MSNYDADYYQRNKEAVLARNKAWQDANQEKVRASQQAWRKANEGRTYLDTSTGYVNYIGYEHPATASSGVTRYHRIVLWDKLNGQDADCNWCGRRVYWDKSFKEYRDGLVTDHVNLDRADNRPENLVPSCQACNVGREGGRRPPMRTKNLGTCLVESCDREAKSLEMCSGHYQQHYAGRQFTELRQYSERMTLEDAERIVERITAGETIVAIGMDTGYDPSAVARAFERVTGLSVREFKKSRGSAQ